MSNWKFTSFKFLILFSVTSMYFFNFKLSLHVFLICHGKQTVWFLYFATCIVNRINTFFLHWPTFSLMCFFTVMLVWFVIYSFLFVFCQTDQCYILYVLYLPIFLWLLLGLFISVYYLLSKSDLSHSTKEVLSFFVPTLLKR